MPAKRLATMVAIGLAVVLAIFVVLRYWNEQIAGFWTESQAVNPPSSLVSLLSISASNLLGDAIHLNNVRLKTEPKSGVFIIEGSQGRQMLVLSDGPKSVALPGTVDIKGQIRRLPPQPTLQKNWHLTAQQADFFEKEDLYIAADYIKNDSGRSSLPFGSR